MATVLIVEDDKNTQLLTAARLKPYFNIICAGDGQEALDMIYKTHVDLIVADIMMPHMDGYGLLKRLREDGNNTPVLLLTAKQSFEDKREGFHPGRTII
jgi:DNA-binding response OmpR family regulator